MGMVGVDVFCMLGDGLFDVGVIVVDYIVGDVFELEGLDVLLLVMMVFEVWVMVDVVKLMVGDIMCVCFGVEFLGIVFYLLQIVFCCGQIMLLDDLKGKKVCGLGCMIIKFFEVLGVEGINIVFFEVLGLLECGVIDCVVIGVGLGFLVGWWEVSDMLVVLLLGGWDLVVIVMNGDKFDVLFLDQQIVLKVVVVEGLEVFVWDVVEGGLDVDMVCLMGVDVCL